MTFESALPYVSIGCAVAAGVMVAIGPPSARRALKGAALLTLAVFAFLRGVAPAAMAMALVLSGLAWAVAAREAGRRTAASTGLFALAWLVLAWLCLREGVGPEMLTDPLRLCAAVLVIAATIGLWLASRGLSDGARLSWRVEVIALCLLGLASLTLRDSQWPAMVGALALFAGHALVLASEVRPMARAARAGDVLVWGLSYLGQAAMAYVFLR